MKKILLASAALIAFGATSAYADDLVTAHKGTLKLDVRLTGIIPDEDAPIRVGSGTAGILGPVDAQTGLHADVNDSYTPTIGLEYYLTDNISVEAIAGTGYHKITVPGSKAVLDDTLGLIDMRNDNVTKVAHLPPTITAKYHFNTKGKFSPYVGVGVSYIWFYSEDSQNGIKVDLDDGAGYAAQLGLDVNTASKWSYNIDVKKIWFETDATVRASLVNGALVEDALRSKVTLDPWVVSVGFGYKF